MELKDKLSNNMQRIMNLSTEKGGSSWLSTLTIADQGFTLRKSAFCDALAMSEKNG